MGSEVTITVIVPAYNAGDHITRCLDSLVNQTFDDFEIIVVDDGSSDDTLALAEKALSKSKIKSTVLSQKHGGVSRARNLGLEKATGRYIYFLDSDDTIDSSTLEKLHSTAVMSDSDCVMCGLRKVDENGNIFWCSGRYGFPGETTVTGDELLPLLVQNRVHFRVGSMMFSMDIAKSNRLRFTPGCTNGEDTEFLLKMFFYCRKISFVDEELLTIHAVQGTASRRPSLQLFHSVGSLRRLNRYLQRHGADGEISYYLEHKRIPHTYVQIIRLLVRMGITFGDYLALAKNRGVKEQISAFERPGNEKSDRRTEIEVKTLLKSPFMFYIYSKFLR